MKIRRALTVLTLCTVGATTGAACGGPTVTTATSGGALAKVLRPNAQNSWLIALRQHADDSDYMPVFIVLNLKTGKDNAYSISGEIDREASSILQVSADYKWFVDQDDINWADSGTLQIKRLEGPTPEGPTTPTIIDLREEIGSPTIYPIRAKFDAHDADLLRILAKDPEASDDPIYTVWDYRISKDTLTKENYKVKIDHYHYTRFNSGTGEPEKGKIHYVRDPEDIPYQPRPQPGGTYIPHDRIPSRLPDGEAVGVKLKSGETWVFNIEGDTFHIYKKPANSKKFGVVKVDATPPLPAGDSLDVAWVRPPSDGI